MLNKFLRIGLVMLVAGLLLAACAPADSATKQAAQPLESGLQQVAGVVLGGGDTTPAGLMDAPRTFIYQVKLDSGEEINVSYTALPPSPAGDTAPAIKLTFYAGEVKAGDYLTARGTYDKATQTLSVAAEGDFIETFEKKP